MTRLSLTLSPDGPSLAVGAGERVLAADPRLVGLLLGGRGAPLGRVELDGVAVPARTSPAARVRLGIAAVVDAPVAPDVTVADHLAARVGRAAARAAVEACPLLAGRADDPAGVLSGGERRALAWVRADVVQPRVVVLRDATVGLDDQAVTWTEGLVAGWLRRGVAVVEA